MHIKIRQQHFQLRGSVIPCQAGDEAKEFERRRELETMLTGLLDKKVID